MRRCVSVPILICAALCGCVAITPRWKVASLDIRVGDTVTTVADGAVFMCGADDSTLGWLVSPTSEKRCLAARSDISDSDQIVAPVPVGTRFRLAKIRHQNRFEDTFYMLYFESPDANIGTVRIHDFHVTELVGEKLKDKPPAPEASAPAIEFLTDSFDLEDIGWMSEQADEFGVDLNVSGLRAIDKDVALLFGGIGVPAGTIRSFLLRTGDGGKSWHEVMSPVLGSELTHVVFSDRQHGWALVQWAVEGPGTMLLFGSTDGGKTWRRLTEIQRSQGHAVPDGMPLSMTFTSALKGEIELAYDGESTSIDDTRMETETLASGDGGVTWSVVRRETRKRPAEEAPEAQQDRGFDSTDWGLDTRAVGGPITVRRFDREQNNWRVTTLPTHFPYGRGRVLTSP